MVISRLAVRRFLDRKLRNSARVKRFTRKSLERRCAKAGLSWPDHLRPYKHQLACLLLGHRYPRYLFFLDMGLGKTVVSLLLFANRRQAGDHPGRLLVLVPASTNVTTWEDEVGTHTPHLRVLGLTPQLGGEERREAIGGGDYDVLVSTYAGFLNHVTDAAVGKGGARSKKASGWRLSDPKVRAFAKGFGTVVFDESTAMLRTHNSLMSRAAAKLASKIPHCYALTGTPHGTNPEHLWSQFKIVDRGETLGTTLGLFRAAYFLEKKDYWKGKVYNFDARMAKHLARTLRHRSIRYEEAECMDLPRLVTGKRVATFTPEAWAYYKKMADELAASKGNFQACESAFIRMRQISGGFLNVTNPEGDVHTIRFKDNPKLDALVDWIGEVPAGEKIVVFNEYILSGELVCERLKKEKVKHLRIYGGTRKKGDVLRRFKADPRIRVLVLNNSSGAYGLNLQVATYGAIYESPTDPVVRRQLMKRMHRGGQTRPVFIYDFLLRKSKDAEILQAIEQGEDLFRKIVDDRSAPRSTTPTFS